MFFLLLLVWLASSSLGMEEASKTNYEQQAESIEYGNRSDTNENGLPLFGTLNGTVTELDSIPPSIKLNKTEATLNCSSGYMSVDLNFQQPFFGIVYADFDRNSACKIAGKGESRDRIQLPLKGCGTLQSPSRVFTNNIVVRFHPGLEIDGDEVITLVCRYPTPLVPPAAIPALLQVPEAPVVRTLQPLKELEVLLIICAVIFLSLLLLGLSCSYYCLKRRNIHVVKKHALSSLGSDVTKVSEPVALFDGLKIPRAHAAALADGSEEAGESVRSDFFSSEGASVLSDAYSSSAFSDKTCILTEGVVHQPLVAPGKPDFDVSVSVRRGSGLITPAAASTASDTEESVVYSAQEQYLTTVLERTEVDTLETMERVRRQKEQQARVEAHIRVVEDTDVDTDDLETVITETSVGTDRFSEQEMEVEARTMANFALHEVGGAGRQVGGAGQQVGHEQRGRRQLRGAVEEHELMVGRENMGYIEESLEMETRSSEHFRSTLNLWNDGRVNNFDVLIRIVENRGTFDELNRRSVSRSVTTVDEAEDYMDESIFTEQERHHLQRVLHEDSSVQRELMSSYQRSELVVLKDFVTLIEPRKWDVLIRVMDNQEDEYNVDDDHRTTISTITPSGTVRSTMGSVAGRTSVYSAADRSETEITAYNQTTTTTRTTSGYHVTEEQQQSFFGGQQQQRL